MDQILGILIVALVICIVVGAIASGLQRLLGFAIIGAIATALIGMATGSSFSLPNVMGAIQPNSGLPNQIETINPAAGSIEGSGSTSAGPANAFGDNQTATGSTPGTATANSGTANSGLPANSGAAPSTGTTGSGSTGQSASTAPANQPRPVNALW